MTTDPTVASAADLAVLNDPVEWRRFTQVSLDAHGVAQAESALRIGGMHCAACAGIVEHALLRVDGVQHARVSAAGERARVGWDPARTDVARIIEAVRTAGYSAAPDLAAPAHDARRVEQRKALWRLFVAAFCAMQVMMLAAPGYVADAGELAPDLRQLLNWGSWLLTWPVLLFSAGPFLGGAWRSIRGGAIGMDVPVALGIVVTFVASSGATFDPGGPFGPDVYFDSLTMFVGFLLGARWLELRARHRAAEALEATMQGMPQLAHRVGADGSVERISAQQVRVGDILRVPLGEVFAADGVVLDGRTEASEALLTGEARPVPKAAGDGVVAGSVNLGAAVTMRADRVGADTRLEGIVDLMRDALSQRPTLARAADRWAAPFLWAVLLLAAGAAAVWSVLDPARALWVAVSVLIVTCPCALSLAVPSAMLAAAGALARRGVLVQRLDALEALAQVRRLYLDKTGTLTRDAWVVSAAGAVAAAAGGDDAARRAQWQADAAALAEWSSHPLARALAEHAGAAASDAAAADRAPAGRAPAAAQAWRDVEEVAGRGLQARDAQGRIWRLGSAAFVGASAPASTGPELRLWFGTPGRPVLAFAVTEHLRDDAAAAVAALRAQGLEVVLLSGDDTHRVDAVAATLGADGAVAHATPQGKLAEVERAQRGGLRVAMVGDGINDAPVLARADVSFAMGQGALVARSQADVVIASGRLLDLAHTRALAQRCMRIVRQNIAWAALYNAVCIPLALAGWLPPWAAGLGMAASSLLVVGNSVRLAR